MKHLLSGTAHRDPEIRFIDLDVEMHDPEFTFETGANGMTFRNSFQEMLIEFDTPIYHRFFIRPDPRTESVARLQTAYDDFLSYCEGCSQHALIINRPSSGFLNSSKIAQMRQLSSFGFSVPPAVVSTLRSVLAAVDGPTVTKGCSGIRSIVRRTTPADFAHIASRLDVPAMLQRFVAGPDVRVHMVDYNPVAIRFETKGDDYRYAARDGFELKVSECELKPGLLPLCWEFVKSERLEFSGFDFKVDENGKWWLLEVNPMPGFSFYDRQCGGRISALLIQALERGYSTMGSDAGLRTHLISSERLPFVDRGGTV